MFRRPVCPSTLSCVSLPRGRCLEKIKIRADEGSDIWLCLGFCFLTPTATCSLRPSRASCIPLVGSEAACYKENDFCAEVGARSAASEPGAGSLPCGGTHAPPACCLRGAPAPFPAAECQPARPPPDAGGAWRLRLRPPGPRGQPCRRSLSVPGLHGGPPEEQELAWRKEWGAVCLPAEPNSSLVWPREENLPKNSCRGAHLYVPPGLGGRRGGPGVLRRCSPVCTARLREARAGRCSGVLTCRTARLGWGGARATRCSGGAQRCSPVRTARL